MPGRGRPAAPPDPRPRDAADLDQTARRCPAALSAPPRPRRRAAPPAEPYQAVRVATSVMPWASSQRSASMAALQPSAAAVTACR